MKKYIAYLEKELDNIATEIVNLYPDKKIMLLTGDLGAGKTALVKSICRYLGVSDKVSSPTFSLVNEYNNGKSKVYHVDLYRVEKQEELFDIGFEEYIDSGNYCFIEWPKMAENFIEEAVKISIKVGSNNERIISIE